MNKDNQFENRFSASPLMSSSFGNTTPERDCSLSDQSFQSPSSSEDSNHFRSNKEEETAKVRNHKKKLERKANSFAYRIREHVRLGPKFSETVKGKLSVGAKIIKKGGRENIFKDIFGVINGEKLLKASQCYLSTSAGPIAGILFISTEKVAFCSERSITVQSSSGALIRTLYKVSIPVKKIKGAKQSENAKNPTQKYIEIVTEDNFEFWFMGFVRKEEEKKHSISRKYLDAKTFTSQDDEKKVSAKGENLARNFNSLHIIWGSLKHKNPKKTCNQKLPGCLGSWWLFAPAPE